MARTETRDAEGNLVSATVGNNNLTVGFERKVNLGNFESATASIFVQMDLPLEASQEDLIDAGHRGYVVAKSVVYNQLGISAEVNPEGIIVEMLQKAGLNAVEVTPAEEQKAIEAAGPSQANVQTPAAKSEDRDDARADLLAAIDGKWTQYGPDGWYDNRKKKKSPKQPDFKANKYNKSIVEGTALWTDKDDEIKGALEAVGK